MSIPSDGERTACPTPNLTAVIKARAFRVILAALDEDDTRRQASVYAELTDLVHAGEGVAFGVLAYLATQLGVILRDKHGTAGAIDVVTSVLAATVLASKDES